MKTITGEATTSAPPATVWRLLADVDAWTRWGSWSKSGVEGGGEQRLGAVRTLTRRPFDLREEITAWEPERRMDYTLLSGMNVEGYRASVTLEPTADGGTLVRWESRYDKAGPLTALVLRMAIPDSAKRLAKAASKR
jgi:uncharacterized protein YndB with AHSA1/START domain